MDNGVRDELLSRFHRYATEVAAIDQRLQDLQLNYPQTKVLTELHGFGLYSATIVIAELSDVERFRRAKQVPRMPD